MGLSSLAALAVMILISSLLPVDIFLLVSQIGGPPTPPQADNVTGDFNTTATVRFPFFLLPLPSLFQLSLTPIKSWQL